MTWLIFAFLSAFFLSLTDLFTKLSSDKINNIFGSLIINLAATITMIVALLIIKSKGEDVFSFKTNGIIYSVLAGIVVAIATIFVLKMFSGGVNLSTAVPVVRIGIIIIGSLIGIILLKESISLRYIAGFLISLVGLYLLVGK